MNLESCGMGPCVRHRTGHSIGREVHGVGANMDNFDTHDERPVIPWTCFSIEPALYLPTQPIAPRDSYFGTAESCWHSAQPTNP